MTEFKTRWRGRTDPLFAEVAEALGTETDLVMAAMPTPGGRNVYAMATPGYPEDKTVIKVLLRRDAGGVLQVIETEEDPELLAKLDREMRRRLDER